MEGKVRSVAAGAAGFLGLGAGLALLTACRAETGHAPTTEVIIQKAPTKSGDRQVGVAGEPLGRDLRGRVTRNGEPVEGVTVYWSTMQGSMDPPVDLTDADGITASRWTTEYVYVEQEAFAGLDPDTAPRVPGSILPGMIMYTAIAAPDPDADNTVLVLSEGGSRFEPASIAVSVGDTVNWVWPVRSADHSIVPDNGDAPGTSGAPTGHSKFLSFRFVIPGVYRYHCAVHGASGGIGMAGTVTVLPLEPPE